MAEHEHCSGHHDDPGPDDRRPIDPAAESLSQALRISFRLLSVIMVLIVVAFLLTGIRSVKPNQSALVYRFGRIVDAVDDGLCFAWPFPIGRIELIETSTHRLEINDFWMAETAEDRLKPLRERRIESKGLRPAWDGALLTGDGYLIHARLTCDYRIGADAQRSLANNPLVLYKQNVNDPDTKERTRTKELIRTAVCEAAIRIAGGQTAQHLKRQQDEFQRHVQQAAQDALTQLQSGIEISSIAVEAEWPLLVRQDFEDAANAAQDKQKKEDAAMAEAERILIGAAGIKYYWLVGRPQDPGAEGEPDEPFNLIGQYEKAVAAGDTAKADELMAEIERTLLRHEIAGNVRPIIDQAVSETNAMLDALHARRTRYEQLLPEYLRDPQFVLARLWADTRETILSNPMAQTYYLPPGAGDVIVKIGPDPDTLRGILQSQIQDDQDEDN